MPRFKHWTPRYITNRLRYWAYERRFPEKPWLTPISISLLESLLLPTDVGFEWGSGRSTRWFASRLKHLTSVESHAGWHQKVTGQIAEWGLKNVDYKLRDAGTVDESECPYTHACDAVEDQSLDFVLIDGMCRATCANRVLPKLAAGGVLVLDNSNVYLDHATHSPISRAGKGPANEHWKPFLAKVENWRMMWTSSGVTDTAIWIVPPGRPDGRESS